MGSKKVKTKETNKPIYGAQIEGAAGNISDAYKQAQPGINAFSEQLRGISGDLFNQYREGDPTIKAAQGYVTDTLAMQPGSNPYLDDMIALTGDNTRRAIQTQLGTRGGIGGSAERDIISRALSQAELGTRYQDYGDTMSRKAQAAGMAPGLLAGSLVPLEAGARYGEAGAMMPLQAANAQAAGIGGLLGQYQTREGEQKQKPGLMDWMGLGLQGASLFSDRRLKTDISRVGQTDNGTPIYTYRYMGQGPYHMGVMADEVGVDAQGPVVEGFATVRYERVA